MICFATALIALALYRIIAFKGIPIPFVFKGKTSESLYVPDEDVLIKEIESWKGFADCLPSDEDRKVFMKMPNDCHKYSKAINAKGQTQGIWSVMTPSFPFHTFEKILSLLSLLSPFHLEIDIILYRKDLMSEHNFVRRNDTLKNAVNASPCIASDKYM
jgi:hypothetical protein